MSRIKVNQISAGQTLQKDAISPKGRLLLTAGTKLEEKHLVILRTWGVVEVDIDGHESADEEPSDNFTHLSANTLAEISEKLSNQFRHCNQGHPFIKELISYQRCRLLSSYSQKEATQ